MRPPKVNELPFSIQAKPVDEGILYELWIRNVCGIAMPYIQMLGEKFSLSHPELCGYILVVTRHQKSKSYFPSWR